MESEIIYHQLDSPSDEERLRRALTSYLRDRLAYRREYPDQSQQVAYEVAGLLSTKFVQQLEDGDPLLDVLLLAGDLELPEEHRGAATWEELAERVDDLPA